MPVALERNFDGLPGLCAPLLTPAEQFVIGACRCWDAFVDSRDPTLAWRELTPVFAYMDVLGALCAFERTFMLLRVHALRPLRFQDGESSTVELDEARMLSSLACLQRGQARRVPALFQPVLYASAVRVILPPLARIAAVLDGRGHRLPNWLGSPLESSAKVGKFAGRARLGDVEALCEADAQPT